MNSEQKIQLNTIWENKNPYEGEGRIRIVKYESGYGDWCEVEWFNCVKYPELNGMKESIFIDDILQHYKQIESL